MSEGFIANENGKARDRLSGERGQRFGCTRSLSDEEIEQDEQGSEEGENHAAAAGVAGNAAKRADKAGGHGFETRVRAQAVEGSDQGIARKTAAHNAGFVLDPNGDFIAAAPDERGTKHEKKIAYKCEKSESRAFTPIHISSQAAD